MATRRETLNKIAEAISELYGEVEARQIAEMVVTECGGISRNELLVEPNKELIINDIERIIEELRQWRPVQYVTGRAEFDGLEFEVAEGVLIPRPETEELVEWIASECGADAKILDVGTGSGCIAISLRRRLRNSHVWALDISDAALEIARRNGSNLAPEVEFIKGDALADFSQLVAEKLDVVVSNPPYIPQSDISAMRVNVVDFEPHNALFVPDDDTLCFYRSIAENASKMLREGGSVWFEIYEEFGAEVCAELERCGFKGCKVLKDANYKDRVVWATR